MITLKKISILTLILTITLSFHKNYAQEKSFWSKVRFGGQIGIDFPNDSFSAIIAPSAVYDVNPYVSLGTGINFGYTNARNFKATNYGISLISLFYPLKELQISSEFEYTGVSKELELDGGNIKEDYWYPALFLGAGYRINGLSIGMRYDVLYNEDKSIYSTAFIPFVNVYF